MGDPAQVLIWGAGEYLVNRAARVTALEQDGVMKVLALIARDYLAADAAQLRYPHAAPHDLSSMEFDYILVMSRRYFGEITEELQALGVSRSKIVGGWVVCTAGFSFERRERLAAARLSCVADDSWCARFFDGFDVRYSSPFADVFIDNDNFLLLLEDVAGHCACRIEPVRQRWSRTFERVLDCKLGDVSLTLCGDTDVECAIGTWEAKSTELDRSHIYTKMSTLRSECEAAFNRIVPADRGICLVNHDASAPCSRKIDVPLSCLSFTIASEMAIQSDRRLVTGLVDAMCAVYANVEGR